MKQVLILERAYQKFTILQDWWEFRYLSECGYIIYPVFFLRCLKVRRFCSGFGINPSLPYRHRREKTSKSWKNFSTIRSLVSPHTKVYPRYCEVGHPFFRNAVNASFNRNFKMYIFIFIHTFRVVSLLQIFYHKLLAIKSMISKFLP